MHWQPVTDFLRPTIDEIVAEYFKAHGHAAPPEEESDDEQDGDEQDGEGGEGTDAE